MSATRAERRKREIARAKKLKELRYKMSFMPFETEDGLKEQKKIGGPNRKYLGGVVRP